jgi:hypothetical protein
MKLSELKGDHLRHLMRELFQFLFDGIKVPNRVMSGYVDQCILHVIKVQLSVSCFAFTNVKYLMMLFACMLHACCGV